MSFSFYVYRGPAGLPAVTQWPHMLSEALGLRDEVRGVLSTLLPHIEWVSEKDGNSFGRGIDPRYNSGFSIWLHENEAGLVSLISTSSHASPHTLALIMKHFRLNYCCTSFGDFRQPSSCDDHWNAD